jgi:hypothetical protein
LILLNKYGDYDNFSLISVKRMTQRQTPAEKLTASLLVKITAYFRAMRGIGNALLKAAGQLSIDPCPNFHIPRPNKGVRPVEMWTDLSPIARGESSLVMIKQVIECKLRLKAISCSSCKANTRQFIDALRSHMICCNLTTRHQIGKQRAGHLQDIFNALQLNGNG